MCDNLETCSDQDVIYSEDGMRVDQWMCCCQVMCCNPLHWAWCWDELCFLERE